MDTIENKNNIEYISYGELINHYVNESQQYADKLLKLEGIINERLLEYEKLEKSFDDVEPTKFNTMARHNIEHEIIFLESLLNVIK